MPAVVSDSDRMIETMTLLVEYSYLTAITGVQFSDSAVGIYDGPVRDPDMGRIGGDQP